MQRMKAVIPPNLLENIERIAVTLEKDKKEYAICDNVKSFGFCYEKDVCVFRHYMLPKIDAPMTNIQINDKVILKLMYIHDTTHFSARIIEYISQSSKSKRIKFSDAEFTETSLKIQKYYQNVENRKVCISTNVGDICILEESIDTFKRVQIMRIRYDKDSSEDVKFVDVRCVDSGIIHECIDVCKLMHIPEELSNLPTHIVEIFLAGVTPYDKEYVWNYHTNEAVHKWYSKSNEDQRSYITGKVCLHLGNTMWLDDLQIRTKLLEYPDMIGHSLKNTLIKDHFAILNDNHIPDLFALCKNSGLTNGHDINAMCK
ncbi:atp-dependent rna helicase tdrd12 isoform x1 [Lasius niger]|uniref:RNA helicase n=1 Tax=Lasius niger TaxID=67767 RepID=A0A0J7KUA5_LASNI|nr:atp-dependent rna helicase tdrd12 isoform x1 [Lasius niger]